MCKSQTREDLEDEMFEAMSMADTEEEADDIFDDYFYQISMLETDDNFQ